MLWVVDGAVHLLANIAHSVFWLLLTAVLWVRILRVSSVTERYTVLPLLTLPYRELVPV